jgi:kumamolisin
VISLLCLGVIIAPAAELRKERKVFTNSVRPMKPSVAATARALPPEHLANTLEVEVPLQMRNYPKLLERLGRGERVSQAEMERDHLPTAADYAAVVKWLKAEGFAITQENGRRLGVFARGTVAQIQQSFQVSMVDVTVDGQAYSAAATNPSLPANIAQPVLGVNGLQPYLKARKFSTRRKSATNAVEPLRNTANAPPYLVKEILGAYNATNLGVTGAGQKIGILIDTVPNDSDLTAFWSHNNISQSLSNIEKVNVTGATLPSPQGEETLDVQWSSGVAPGAKIRIYATATLSFTNIDKALQRIIDDLPSQPQLRVLSISLGLGETYLSGSSEMQTESQYFATLAAAGVTVLVSSGDEGSNPDTSNDGNATGPLQVEYEASDPSVTGVGGTSLTLNSTTGAVVSETAWSGSGGGTSSYFSRPAWQVGTGVPSGTKRLVPDVSLVASNTTYAYFYFQGKADGIAGTSWSAPTWAGFCALINQARTNASMGSLGLLNPTIYPLLGTTNFRDITSGSNGSYSAGTGYDRVTGIGVPNVSVLLGTLTGTGSGTPSITSFNPTSGPAGTSVTILGTNLGGASAVTFNGTSATFTNNSSTQISATVPAGATTGTISVVTSAGTATSSSNFTVTSAAPSNDNFASAQTISGPSGTASGNNSGATAESGEPLHAGSIARTSVWYAWTPATSGTYTFDTFGSTFDTLLAIYRGNSVSGLTQTASNDDYATGVTSSVSFTATAGTSYHIAVDGFSGATGSITLHWALNTAAPAINNFVPDTGTAGTPVTINGANFTGATAVAFNGISASFSVVSSTQIDTTVPTAATTGVVTVTTPGGTATSAGVFVVNTIPANDNFANATVLSGASGTSSGLNANATKEAGEPNHAGNPGGHSVWYSWTAPASGPCNFNTFGSSFDTELAIYTGTAVNNLTLIAANEDSGSVNTSSVSFDAIGGTTYRIAVDGYTGATGNVALAWSSDLLTPQVSGFSPTSGAAGTVVTITGLNLTGATSVDFHGTEAGFTVNSDTQITATVPTGATTGPISITNLVGTGASSADFTISSAPPNDQFANATLITGSNAVTGTNIGGSKESGEPSHAGNVGGRSVWWKWTAPSTGSYVISTRGSSFDTVLGVYTGTSVANLTLIANNDDDPAGGVTSSLAINATSGTTYQIAVDGFNGTAGSIVLSVLAAGGSATTLFSTAFETTENYSTATATLSGQNGWTSAGSGGNGVVNGFIGGQGQQGYIGFTAPTSGETSLEVWHPVNFVPQAGDNVTFSTTMAVIDSSNQRFDRFQWRACNAAGHSLFYLEFNNQNFGINYGLDDGVAARSTGFTFRNGQIYTLQFTIDFTHNHWTASLNGTAIVTNQAITTTNATLNLGSLRAGWRLNASIAGNNYLLFDNYSLTTSPSIAPQIVLAPQSQSATVGDTVTLSVVATGSDPLTYQWKLGTSNINGATSSSLTLSDVQLSTAGSYSVVLTNTAGSVQSDPAQLTVVPPPNQIDLIPYKPGGWSDNIVVTRNSLSTTDSANLQNTDSLYVDWATLNNSPQTTPNGFHCSIYVDDVLKNTWSAGALPGGYFTYVRGFSIGSLTGGSHTVSLKIDSSTEVTETNETNNTYIKTITVGHIPYLISASASPANGGQVSGDGVYNSGTTATLIATPATGFVFVNWAEGGNSVSDSATYQFTVAAARTLVAKFAPDTTPPNIGITFPTLAATFDTTQDALGLAGFASDDGTVTSVTWENDRGGSGTASGTTSWTIASLPLKSGINHLAITAHDTASNTSTAHLTVTSSPIVDFATRAGQYAGLLEATNYHGLGRFSVTSRGTFTGTIGFESVVTSVRGKFASDGSFTGTVARKNRTPLTLSLAVSTSDPASITGTIGDGNLSTTLAARRNEYNAKSNPCPYFGRYTVALQKNDSDATAPRGDGVARLLVRTNGTVTLNGWLADGAVLSQGVIVVGTNQCPLYRSLYTSRGYYAGAATFENLGATQLDGLLDWTRPALPASPRFSTGFSTRLTLAGNTFAIPQTGHTLMPTGTRSLTLEDGGLLSTIQKSISFTPPSTLKILDPALDKLTLRIAPTTGLLSGNFVHPITHQRAPLHGALRQAQDKAPGFFLSTDQAGAFELGAAP